MVKVNLVPAHSKCTNILHHIATTKRTVITITRIIRVMVNTKMARQITKLLLVLKTEHLKAVRRPNEGQIVSDDRNSSVDAQASYVFTASYNIASTLSIPCCIFRRRCIIRQTLGFIWMSGSEDSAIGSDTVWKRIRTQLVRLTLLIGGYQCSLPKEHLMVCCIS